MDPTRKQKIRRTMMYIGAGTLITAVTLYLALPVVALFFRTTPELFISSLRNPEVAGALWLSLFTSALSLGIVILLGTPFAWVDCRFQYQERCSSIPLLISPLSFLLQSQVSPCSCSTGGPAWLDRT